MSHISYNKQWQDAQIAMVDMLAIETPEQPRGPENDINAAFQLVATMFVKYVQIFRKLEQCYDQIVHPQKRRLIRIVLDGCMGRIIELKHEMISMDYSEYHYFDDILADLKLTPNDLEIPIPNYFVLERAQAIEKRERLLGQILARMTLDTETQETTGIMTMDDAIRIIQSHERARQGRLRAKQIGELRLNDQRARQRANMGESKMDKVLAATIIQKYYRRYVVRREAMPTFHKDPLKRLLADVRAHEDERRKRQEKHEITYQQALIATREKIKQTEGPDMKERLQDQIRQCKVVLSFCRNVSQKFPDFPDEDDGGSNKIFEKKTVEEIQEDLDAKLESKGKGKGDKKGKKGKKGKKKKKGDDEEGWALPESQFVTEMIKPSTGTYQSFWETRDESNNFEQNHDSEIVKEEKRTEVQEEIRIEVDALMREELKNLKAAIDKSKEKKKKKKKKKAKKKKKKKEKDLTPDRTIESLYEELVMNRIIIRPPKVALNDFLGDFNYLPSLIRQAKHEPMPTMYDVKQLTALYGILPFGSEKVHELAPQIKGLLICGPRGCGKHMLLHAICNELGANLFDISPQNIYETYREKEGIKMLMHLCSKVGKALQPTIILINDCEKLFKKKLKPEEKQFEPKRLAKALPKWLKTIKPGDRVLLVGISHEPYQGVVKPMMKAFQRAILLPRPEYGTRLLLWKTLIPKYGGIITPVLDLTSLAKLSDSYAPGHIHDTIVETLTERRLSKMSKHPLQASDFIPGLAHHNAIYKEEEDAYKSWWKKTPLGKKRERFLEDQEEGGGDGKGKKDKKGGGKGKGKKGKGKKKK
ncbi:unnamed protein product [Rotaria sp. Silwood2]|nr:unnamed protein product [Rotaria sp. Silwood2]CAF3887194.1 unnamed protein product [Rotaria sp. Silwood2]